MTSIDEILSTLNPKQAEAVAYNGGPCLIIAGAGTGKTKTLTCKVAKLISDGVSPSRILAVTFTNKAAQEMRERIDALVPGAAARVWIHTFHSFAMRILRFNAQQAGLNKDFVIYDETEQKKIITLVLAEMGIKEEKKEVNFYVSCISRAKDDMLDPESYAIHAHASGLDRRIQAAEIYRRYQKKLTAAGALDFGDLLMKVVELFRNNEQVRGYYQDYFQYILVDEYQDTNHTQYTLTRSLAFKHRNLCVVGDPDQSIYSWRGANIRNILEFEQDFKDAKVITLEQNYRSTQVILDASNMLIKKNKNRREKSLFTEQKTGEPIHLNELATEGEEARWVANQIENLVNEDGLSLNDMAVFYRTNAQSRSFEDTFRRYQIPYRLIGTVGFYDRAEVKDILAYARLVVNTNDIASFLRVINNPTRGFGGNANKALQEYAVNNNVSYYEALKANDFIENISSVARRGAKEFERIIEDLRKKLDSDSPSMLIRAIQETSGYRSKINELADLTEAENKKGHLDSLVSAVEEYEKRCRDYDMAPTLAGYLQEVQLITSADSLEDASDNGKVTLMTVHLAKGLEFPAVFVTGMEEGLFPLKGRGDDDLEEERRLCYVAMTRAKKMLFMTYCATRRLYAVTYANMASRFLFDSGLMQTTEYPQGNMERREISPYNRYNKWTSNNSTSYDNSSNYKDTIPMSQQREQKYYDIPAEHQAPSDSTEQSAPARSAAGGGVHIGSRVRHGVFGEGKVTSVAGSGEAAKITVIFSNGTKRVFMLKYAPLEIL